jgi:hypothetical protein
MAAYTAAVCWRLSIVGYWNVALLKDTLLWFCFSGLTLGFASNHLDGFPAWWRRALADQIKLVLVLEYIISTYTFSLLAELVLQPTLLLLIIVSAIGRSKEEFGRLARAADLILTFLGLGLIAALVQAVISSRLSGLGVSDVRAILLPPILTATFVPVAYLFHVLAAYQTLFLRTRFALARDERLLRQAKWRLVRMLGPNLVAVQRFTKIYSSNWTMVTTWVELDNFLLFSRLQLKQ